MIKRTFNNIRAVGFDVDGTLYFHSTESTIAISRKVAEHAAALLHRDVDDFEQEYLELREKYKSNTQALNSLGLDGEGIFQRVFDAFPVEKHVVKDVKMAKLLTDLKVRYRLFIISNGAQRQVARKLAAIGVDIHDFDPMICCYDHGWLKPEPAPFLAALEALALKPSEVVYIGDRSDVDVDAARAVGMKTIYVGGTYPSATASVQEVYDIGQLLFPAR